MIPHQTRSKESFLINEYSNEVNSSFIIGNADFITMIKEIYIYAYIYSPNNKLLKNNRLEFNQKMENNFNVKPFKNRGNISSISILETKPFISILYAQELRKSFQLEILFLGFVYILPVDLMFFSIKRKLWRKKNRRKKRKIWGFQDFFSHTYNNVNF